MTNETLCALVSCLDFVLQVLMDENYVHMRQQKYSDVQHKIIQLLMQNSNYFSCGCTQARTLTLSLSHAHTHH
jgi:hypothetical protein